MAKGENVPCVVTGKTVYFSASLLASKAEKFGSIEQFRRHYVSTPARKILREGFTVEQTREKLNAGHNLPKVSQTVLENLGLYKPRKHKAKQKEVVVQKRADPAHRAKVQAQQREEAKQLSTKQGYIEWLTGGPNGVQRYMGGTCHRPDIRVNNSKLCEYWDNSIGGVRNCPYWDHCCVDNKKISR